MSRGASTSEWPLVTFTVGIQLAGGLVLADVVARALGGGSQTFPPPFRIAAFVLVILATASSLFHLGRPHAAVAALRNVARSRLSVEVVVTAAFAIAAGLHAALVGRLASNVQLACGLSTAGLALAAVMAGAAIYMVPTRPVWNSAWVPMSFLGTTLLLGGCWSIPFAAASGTDPLLGILLAGIIAGSALVIVSAGWMLVRCVTASAGPPPPAPVLPTPRLTTADRLLLALHLVLAGTVPAGAIWLWSAMGDGSPAVITPVWRTGALLTAVAAIAGATVGRRLMYTLGTPVPRF